MILAPGGGSKADRLREASEAFLRKFRDSRDRISLITYNLVGRLVRSNREGFVVDDWVNDLTTNTTGDFSPKGHTNTSDALYVGYEDYRTLNNQKINYVLFTDGPPTAGRFLFENPQAGLPGNPNSIWQEEYDSTIAVPSTFSCS